MTRVIRSLDWAYRGKRPRNLPIGEKGTHATAAGVRYERELFEAIPIAHHGVWWAFSDQGWKGWCQTDLLLRGTSADLVLEAKYSYTEEAWGQLEGLYIPVVTRALERQCWGIQVCKRFLAGVGPGVAVANDLATALDYAKEGRRTVLHWLGPKRSPPLWPIRGHLAQAA